MDNSSLGLNEYLQPLDSPVTQSMGAVTAYDYSYGIDQNAVTDSKISSLSADKISAGSVIVPINLGSSSGAYLLLDGANNRIVVNDGTTNRVVIGSV